jgi:hypothetical protein
MIAGLGEVGPFAFDRLSLRVHGRAQAKIGAALQKGFPQQSPDDLPKPFGGGRVSGDASKELTCPF